MDAQEKLQTVEHVLMIKLALLALLASSMMQQQKLAKLAQMDVPFVLMPLLVLHANLDMPRLHQIHAKHVVQIALRAMQMQLQLVQLAMLEPF